MSFSVAAIPSDSVTAPDRRLALMKLEYSTARMVTTTVNGTSNSRAMYRSMIFKEFCGR
jgi:hypothetical protein